MSAFRRRGNAILPTRFFKIILKTNLERTKIPDKFTGRYGGGLSNPVFLKPPDGTKWRVHWKKLQNGEVYFEKGWKEFTDNYSLDHGYLVLFKYDGTSQLDVFILDQSALEIDYPSRGNCDEKDNLDQSDDESVKTLNGRPDQKARQKSPLFSPRSRKKKRGDKVTQRTSSLNWPRDRRAREVAAKFISYNPFFTALIKPNHLAENQMNVPSLKGYIENEVKNVILQLGKRSWHVKLLRCRSLSYRCFSAGWPVFARENKLQPGDVCIFELINRECLVFKVHVFNRHN